MRRRPPPFDHAKNNERSNNERSNNEHSGEETS